MMKLRAILEDVAKTSHPKTLHQLRREKIAADEVQSLTVVGYGKYKGVSERTDPRPTITSKLYNPCRGELPDLASFKITLNEITPNALILPMLVDDNIIVQTKYGIAPFGSVLAVQQKLHSHYIFNVYDGVEFAHLPVMCKMDNHYNFVPSLYEIVELEGLNLKISEIYNFEEQTSLQSDSKLWHKLRKFHLTASRMHSIYVRRKNHETLVARLKSDRISEPMGSLLQSMWPCHQSMVTLASC